MDYRLVYCLRNGLPLDMDVYDLAEWCRMAELTRLSIENGNAPVAVQMCIRDRTLPLTTWDWKTSPCNKCWKRRLWNNIE